MVTLHRRSSDYGLPARSGEEKRSLAGTVRPALECHFFRRDSFRDQEALALNKSALSRSNFAIGRSRADSRDYAPEENLRSMGCVQYPGYKTLRTHCVPGRTGGNSLLTRYRNSLSQAGVRGHGAKSCRMRKSQSPKRTEGNLVGYVCPVCGGWDRLCAVYRAFLPFVDHLIQDLCLKMHPKLQQPFLVDNYLWFRIPDRDEIIHGLPRYEPNSLDWKRLLEKGEKILPQAKLFLPDIADWLEKALTLIEQLNSIVQSDLLVAEQLVELVKGSPDEFQEQRSDASHGGDTCRNPSWPF